MHRQRTRRGLLAVATAVAALVAGAAGTFLFGRAMSQRTRNRAYMDAMLTAYRRTLQKTMEQASSMGEVVAWQHLLRVSPGGHRRHVRRARQRRLDAAVELIQQQ